MAPRGGADVRVAWTSLLDEERRFLPADAPAVPSLAAAPKETQILVTGLYDPVAANLPRFPHLRAIVTRSDGHDHLDPGPLRRRGVALYHLGGYATTSVATLAVTFILGLLRRLPEATSATRAGRFARATLVGRGLPDVTVGLLGLGRIGLEVATILDGLGARVLYHDIRKIDAGLPLVRPAASFEDLLARSDVLSLHVPLDDRTRGLIDAKALARMPRGAVLVNTARGAIVDQVAVRDALLDQHLAGYAADVLPEEPKPNLDLFRALENVMITPHLGAHNIATFKARMETASRIVAALQDERDEDIEGYRIT